MPKTICRTCQKFIEQFYEFRAQVEISDKAMRSYLKLSQSNVQNVYEDSLEINNSMKDIMYPLVMSSNENVQVSTNFQIVTTQGFYKGKKYIIINLIVRLQTFLMLFKAQNKLTK